MTAHWFDGAAGQGEIAMPAMPAPGGDQDLAATWRTGAGPGAVTARATIALALLALGAATTADAADAAAERLWADRLGR
jgi:hypothetical protein